jgi:signal transduction histidine kinase
VSFYIAGTPAVGGSGSRLGGGYDPASGYVSRMLSGSELWLLRLMADRGLALLDASTLLMVIEERRELRVAAASGEGTPRLRIMPVEGSALGALYRAGQPVALDRPRGPEAAWLHELGLEARAALVEPLSMEGHGGGLVIALRRDGGFRGPDRQALAAFAASVAQRLAAERSVEIERLRYGMEARERERTRWAREIHDETVQGLGALRLKLADARDQGREEALSAAVDGVLEGLGAEIDGLRHLITELRPAALDDLGLVPALQALARRAQAIDGLDVQTAIDLDPLHGRLDAELESTIYRVVQEALTNVSRHAHATRAVVTVALSGNGVALNGDGSTVRVSISDDGRGLPAGGAGLGPRGDGLEGGFGMSGMRERAELVGGELEIGAGGCGDGGGGATVRLTVPLAGRPAGSEPGSPASATASR